MLLPYPILYARNAQTGEIHETFFAAAPSVVGSLVTVTIDRPLGTYHPEHADLYYPINYGYIKDIMAPDQEEQDAYILGVSVPVETFTGRVIAVIHRDDDAEEKWVVAPDGMAF